MAPHIDIREAAEKLVRYLPKFIEWINYYGIDGYYKVSYHQDLKELNGRIDFLKSALAEPPRNCDRFAPRTTDEVKAIIDEWRATARGPETNSFYAFIRWFLAPVEGGETDGSK